MIKTERDMFKELKKLELALGENNKIHFISIETGNTELGVPDVYYYVENMPVTGWIELKIGKTNKDGSISIPYRPKQKEFLNKHSKSNLHTYTLLYLNNNFFLMGYEFKDEFESAFELNQCVLWAGHYLSMNFIDRLVIGDEYITFPNGDRLKIYANF